MTLPGDAIQKLHMALPSSRVHSRDKGGKSLDYIAAHDAIRTANAIFGFGQWGFEIADLTCVGQEQVVSKDGKKKGYRVGYRCTLRLTVVGCEPVSGVGYGDAIDYQDSAVTPHENAAKEAESDALKRALHNYGDQFGLILYASKGDERQRVEREAAVRRERAAQQVRGVVSSAGAASVGGVERLDGAPPPAPSSAEEPQAGAGGSPPISAAVSGEPSSSAVPSGSGGNGPPPEPSHFAAPASAGKWLAAYEKRFNALIHILEKDKRVTRAEVDLLFYNECEASYTGGAYKAVIAEDECARVWDALKKREEDRAAA